MTKPMLLALVLTNVMIGMLIAMCQLDYQDARLQLAQQSCLISLPQTAPAPSPMYTGCVSAWLADHK